MVKSRIDSKECNSSIFKKILKYLHEFAHEGACDVANNSYIGYAGRISEYIPFSP